MANCKWCGRKILGRRKSAKFCVRDHQIKYWNNHEKKVTQNRIARKKNLEIGPDSIDNTLSSLSNYLGRE